MVKFHVVILCIWKYGHSSLWGSRQGVSQLEQTHPPLWNMAPVCKRVGKNLGDGLDMEQNLVDDHGLKDPGGRIRWTVLKLQMLLYPLSLPQLPTGENSKRWTYITVQKLEARPTKRPVFLFLRHSSLQPYHAYSGCIFPLSPFITSSHSL